jgi:hypothetical protein
MNSPIQAAPVLRGISRAYQHGAFEQQGCDLFLCAPYVVMCLATGACADHSSAACQNCLGHYYATCKDCL